MTTNNPFYARPLTVEEPLANWERELLGGGHPAPLNTERVWSVGDSITESHRRGTNVAQAVVDLDEDTATPSRDVHWIPRLPSGKAHRARHAPRLTDGMRHPVTVRKIGA